MPRGLVDRRAVTPQCGTHQCNAALQLKIPWEINQLEFRELYVK
jgi:hypothetical protein